MSILKNFRKAQTERDFSILFGIGDVVYTLDDKDVYAGEPLFVSAIYVDKNGVKVVAGPVSSTGHDIDPKTYDQMDLMLSASEKDKKPNPQFWPGDHVFVKSENTDGFVSAAFLTGKRWKYKLGTSLFNVDASDLKLIEEQNKPDIGDEQVLA